MGPAPQHTAAPSRGFFVLFWQKSGSTSREARVRRYDQCSRRRTLGVGCADHSGDDFNAVAGTGFRAGAVAVGSDRTLLYDALPGALADLLQHLLFGHVPCSCCRISESRDQPQMQIKHSFIFARSCGLASS